MPITAIVEGQVVAGGTATGVLYVTAAGVVASDGATYDGTTYTVTGPTIIDGFTAAQVGLSIVQPATPSANAFQISSVGTSAGDVFKIDSAGAVGIGTATPYSLSGYTALTLNGTTGSVIQLQAAGTKYGQIFAQSGGCYLDSANGASILLRPNGNTKFSLDATGAAAFSGPTIIDGFTAAQVGLSIVQPAVPSANAFQISSVGTSSGDVFKIDSAGNITASGTVTVPDEAYGVGWNGNLTVPTKNAVYDKIETISAGTPEGTAVLSTGEVGGTKFLREDGDGTCSWQAAAGSGDVVGPASATDNALARYDATTGKLVQNSVAILTDAGALTGVTSIDVGTGTVTAGIFSATAPLPGDVPIKVKGAVSHTASLQEWQNSGGTVLSCIDKAGKFGFGSGLVSYPVHIKSMVGAGGAVVAPATWAANDSAFLFSSAYVGTGTLYLLDAAANTSGGMTIRVKNNGTGVANTVLWAAGTGDAYHYYLAGSEWSHGVDNSDSDKFKIAAGGNLTTSTRMTVTTGGLFGINTTTPVAQFEIHTSGIAIKGNIIKAFAGQTAALSEWQNSSGTAMLSVKADGDLEFANATDITFGTTTGTMIGTASTQKLAFYGATPVVQTAHVVDADGTLADITTKFNQVLADLASLGLQAAS